MLSIGIGALALRNRPVPAVSPGDITTIRLHRSGVPTPMVPNVLRPFQR